ncbi:hypothetical protein ColLi_09628 [Colletotrichum liriopes]|uniref:Uncharacterized protein n=1 Tax=Colletotrichum liriopes TaxID=708192 RepID=A0AA37GU32_9PEZI|nr:hypothetical protein ColLi_09628 [Colletotrichum liriopes]
MANSKPANADSAEALHGLLNDVTGKALRSQSKEGRSQVQAQISLQTKIPELIDTFHWKLDDLENESKGGVAEGPGPIPARTTARGTACADRGTDQIPIAIDLDSSSREVSPENKTEVTEATGPHRVPAESSTAPSMAPFPDMGVSFQPQPEPAQPVKQETTPAPPAMMAPMSEVKSESKPTPPASQPQPSGAPEAPMDDLFGLGGGGGGGEGGDAGGGNEANDSEFHFTDMTFSLAPANNDPQPQPQAQEAPMDISFGSGDMGGDLLSLDNLLTPDNSAAKQEPGAGAAPAPPADTATATAAAAAAAPPAAADQQKPAEAKMEKQDSSLDDLFALDGNTSMDDMDLDMNMGGEGGDGNNFDDMMFFDDTEMEHGKFDEDFFQIQ